MNQTVQSKITEIAALLRIDPAWLDSVIKYETGGTYDPLKKNPFSSARGLIQIIDKTARDTFGYQDSLSLVNDFPDFDSQMDNVVYPYLKQFMPYPTKQSLYMAVFFPAARFFDPSTTFRELYQKLYPNPVLQKDGTYKTWEGYYDDFVKGNPGILSVNDYVQKVDSKSGFQYPSSKISVLIGALIIAGIIIIYKRYL